jgi:hypothetical protein
MPDHPSRDLDALWRQARHRLTLVDREPALTMAEVDHLIAAGILDDRRLRRPDPQAQGATS